MRLYLLFAVTVLAANTLTGCTRAVPPIPEGMVDVTERSAVAPLAQARIQVREVVDPGAPNATTIKDRDGNALTLREPAFITTADVASVAIGTDAGTGWDTLVLHFTDEASPRILAATQARVGRQVAFTIGDQVLNVAVIAGPFGKAMQVSTLDATAETRRLYTEITGKAP